MGSAEVGEHDNDDGFDISAIELAIKQENSQLKSENKRLHDLTTSLHERHNLMSAEFSELHDNLATSQKELNDMNTKVFFCLTFYLLHCKLLSTSLDETHPSSKHLPPIRAQ